jgi:hypothetical protein
MRHWLFTLFIAASLAAIAAPATAVTTVDTTGSDVGTVSAFGAPDTATYGQTFTVTGTDTTLSTFSLFLRNREGGSGPLDLRGYIGPWDGSKATAILYESGTQTMNAAGNLQEFAFDPNVSLVSGQTYVAFLSISNLGSQPTSTFGMPFGIDSVSGEFVYLNNGTAFGDLSSQSWSGGFTDQQDAWFKATFVPEPTTGALLGLGLTGVAAAGRKRRSAQ